MPGAEGTYTTTSSDRSARRATNSARRWWTLATVAVAQLIVVLDSTVVNVALPTAQADLGFSNADRQWIITAYSLAFGSLLLLGGRISDLIGRRRAFLFSVLGFAAASALAGAAGNFEVLVTARALQGAAAAVLAPTALSVLTTTFIASAERSRAFAVYSAVSGAGAALGLLLGGVLTQELSWRWTLYINVFFAAVAALGAMLFITPALSNTSRPSLDGPGAVLGGGGLFALVFGSSRAETDGWHATGTWGALVLSAVLLVAFVVWQQHATAPLLPLKVLVDRDRGASVLATLLANVGMFGALLFVTYYVRGTLHYSPVTTGLAFLPLVVMLAGSAQLASLVLLPRLGPNTVVPMGMLLAAGGMVWLTNLSATSSYATDIGGSIGTALLNPLALAATSSYLAAHHPATRATIRASALHGYRVAYWWGAGTYGLGAVLTAVMFRPRAARAFSQPSVS